MTQWEGQQSSKIVFLKINNLRNELRRMQLKQYFSPIRNKMLKDHQQIELRDFRKQHTYALDSIISQIAINPQRSIANLWAYCLSFQVRYLTEQHIHTLTATLIAISKQHKQQQVKMIVILIVNWASVTSAFTLDYSQLFRVLVALLRESKDSQLKQYILFGLSNFCSQRNNGILLMRLQAISAVEGIGEDMGQDVCCFLSNLIQALPLQFHWDERTLESITIFLRGSLNRAFSDYLLEDSVSILKRLFLTQYRTILINFLSLDLKIFIESLFRKPHSPVWPPIFQILTIIYEQGLEISSPLLQPVFCCQIWLHVQWLLQIDDQAEEQSFNGFSRCIWAFIETFIRLPLQGRQTALLWLRRECLQRCRKWQERALKLLVVALSGKLALELIEFRLCQFQSLSEPTTTMLRVLLEKTKQRQVDSRTKSMLQEAITAMKYDEREEIANLASEIGSLWADQSFLCTTDGVSMRWEEYNHER